MATLYKKAGHGGVNLVLTEGGKLATSFSCCCEKCPEDCNDSEWDDESRFDTKVLAEAAILYTCTEYAGYCGGFVRFVGPDPDNPSLGPWAITCCEESSSSSPSLSSTSSYGSS